MTIPAFVVTPAIQEILETMYFMSPEYCGEGPAIPDSYIMGVEFSGPISGRFTISVGRPLARRMAADFLAEDVDAVEPAIVESTISELANIACGAALAAWNPDQDFVFSVPFRLEASDTLDHQYSVFGPGPEMSVGLDVREREPTRPAEAGGIQELSSLPRA